MTVGLQLLEKYPPDTKLTFFLHTSLKCLFDQQALKKFLILPVTIINIQNSGKSPDQFASNMAKKFQVIKGM